MACCVEKTSRQTRPSPKGKAGFLKQPQDLLCPTGSKQGTGDAFGVLWNGKTLLRRRRRVVAPIQMTRRCLAHPTVFGKSTLRRGRG